MKKTFIIILIIQAILNILFFVYAIMAKTEANKAKDMAIENEKEAIKQHKLLKIHKEYAEFYEKEAIKQNELYKSQSNIIGNKMIKILELEKQLNDCRGRK